METLEERRVQARLSMAYKIINGYVILESNMLPKANIKHTHRKCNGPKVGIQNQLFEPQSRLKTTGKTFFYSIQKVWNQKVTPSQALAPSVDSFKTHVKRNVA